MSESISTEPRNKSEGRQFTPMQADLDKPEADDRHGKTFSPAEDATLNTTPESITAGERLPHFDDYSGIRLEALPLKGLKTFIYSLGVLLLVLLSWDLYRVFMSALAVHWLVATGFIALVGFVTGLGLRAGLQCFNDRDNQAALDAVRQQAERLSQGQDYGKAKKWLEDLQAFYTGKPQGVYLQRCLDSLPDYSNDREVVEHLERVFIDPLDQEALRRVSLFSVQTGVAVAVSPWASVDMLLSLWRSLKLIDEVAQVYGMRPSLLNRYRLIKKVMHQLVFVGMTEVLVDQWLEESVGVSLVGMASARATQGMGAGIYSARIGLAAMSASRPMAFTVVEQPRLKSLLGSMVKAITTKLKGQG